MAKTKVKSQKARSAPAPKAKKARKGGVRAMVSTRATPLPAGPPPPPPPPPPRDELSAPRDVARLLRYGERFGSTKIDVRMLPLQLPASSGRLALFDPGVPKSWHAFDRPAGTGQFRVMLSVARSDQGAERLAAIVIHVGRPPIARWTVAHYVGQKKPKSADQLPRCEVTTGWIALLDAGQGSPGIVAVPPAPATGTSIQPVEIPLTDGRRALALPCGNGDFAAYWAVDSTDKPVCLIVDFDVFSQKEWKARPTGA